MRRRRAAASSAAATARRSLETWRTHAAPRATFLMRVMSLAKRCAAPRHTSLAAQDLHVHRGHHLHNGMLDNAATKLCHNGCGSTTGSLACRLRGKSSIMLSCASTSSASGYTRHSCSPLAWMCCGPEYHARCSS